MKKTSIALAIAMTIGSTATFAATQDVTNLDTQLQLESKRLTDVQKTLADEGVIRSNSDIALLKRITATEKMDNKLHTNVAKNKTTIRLQGEQITQNANQITKTLSDMETASKVMREMGKVVNANTQDMNENRSGISANRQDIGKANGHIAANTSSIGNLGKTASDLGKRLDSAEKMEKQLHFNVAQNKTNVRLQGEEINKNDKRIGDLAHAVTTADSISSQRAKKTDAAIAHNDKRISDLAHVVVTADSVAAKRAGKTHADITAINKQLNGKGGLEDQLDITIEHVEHTKGLVKKNDKRISDLAHVVVTADSIAAKRAGKTNADIHANADKISRVNQKATGNTAGIAVNQDDIASNKGKIKTNSDSITTNSKSINDLNAGLETTKEEVVAVKGTAKDNTKNITINTHKLDNHESRISVNEDKLDAAENLRQTQSALLEKAINDEASQLAATQAELKTTQSTVTNNTNRINKLEDKVNDNSYGIAMAMAMSALPPAYSVGDFNVAAGVGNYDGKSAVAVGMGYRMSESVNFKFSVSHGGDKTGASAGVAYSF